MVALFMLTAGASRDPNPAPPKIVTQARIRAGNLLHCRKLLRQVWPAYPEEARRDRVEGAVSLNVLITRTGEVTGIRVAAGDPRLAPAAVAAVRQWRYASCLLNSEPVEVHTAIDIGFTLQQ